MKLNKRQTTLVLTIYAFIALFVRFVIEPRLGVNYIQSISLGIATLFPIWILFKIKFFTLSEDHE